MERKRIPVVAEPVSDCSQCNPSACCLSNTVMQLTNEEVGFMRSSGNYLIPAVPPTDRFRADAPYPIAWGLGADKRLKIYTEKGRETEPLEAGYGRYIMVGDCKNLETDLLGRTICSAYDQRPEVCISFTPGSDACHKMQTRRDSVDQ